MRVLVTYDEAERFVTSVDGWEAAWIEAKAYRLTLVRLGKYPEYDVFLRPVDRYNAIGLFVRQAVELVKLEA